MGINVAARGRLWSRQDVIRLLFSILPEGVVRWCYEIFLFARFSDEDWALLWAALKTGPGPR